MSKKTKTEKTVKTAKVAKAGDKPASGKPARAEKGAGKAAFAYDAEKDIVVKELGTVETGSMAGDILVRVVSYNGGAKKLLVARTGVKKSTGETWFTPKLGRLTKAEVEAVLPLITKAIKHLD
jgi:hypothetical protein